jgi:hypothetical protein
VDGSRTEGGQQGTGSGQVVQLEREWFGPIAELIPIGQPERAPVVDTPTPVSAADFWGGGADLLQEVVERAGGDLAAVEPEPVAAPFVAAVPRFPHLWSRPGLAVGAVAAVLIVIGVFFVHAGPTSPGVFRHPVLSAAVVTRPAEHRAVARHHAAARRTQAHRTVRSTSTDVTSNSATGDYTPVSVVNNSTPPPP